MNKSAGKTRTHDEATPNESLYRLGYLHHFLLSTSTVRCCKSTSYLYIPLSPEFERGIPGKKKYTLLRRFFCVNLDVRANKEQADP